MARGVPSLDGVVKMSCKLLKSSDMKIFWGFPEGDEVEMDAKINRLKDRDLSKWI
jgi:hypothetical protein